MTLFDWLDLAVVLTVVAVQIFARQHATAWSVMSLALYHIAGRIILDQPVEGVDTMITLGTLQTVLAIGYLSSRWLTLYGVLVGVLWATLSLTSWVAVAFDLDTAFKNGLGLDIWNVQSALLHIIALATIGGIVRHKQIMEPVRGSPW